jgi:actin-related protein
MLIGRFSQGKPTALVVDIGASMTQITPVFDGTILKKGNSTQQA